MVGLRRLDASNASGIISSASFATHWCAPPGLLVNSHSKPKRFSKKLLLHLVGVFVHVTSMPLVMVSGPFPVPKLLLHPKPCASIPAASGSLPTCSEEAAPCVLPKL